MHGCQTNQVSFLLAEATVASQLANDHGQVRTVHQTLCITRVYHRHGMRHLW